MVKANNIEPEDIASVTISTTPDINSAFPAKSVRTYGRMAICADNVYA